MKIITNIKGKNISNLSSIISLFINSLWFIIHEAGSPECCSKRLFIRKQCEWEACTFPCMSSRSVRVTPKPPSPKSCSQFIVMWEWHAGRRMNKAHSLVTQLNEGQHSFSGSPRSFSAALRDREKKKRIK